MEHLLLGLAVMGVGFVVWIIIMSACILSGRISKDEERRGAK